DVSIQFVLAAAQNDHGLVESIIKSSRLPESLTLRVVRSETFDALNAADAAAISSGTATLEAGIIGTPMAIVYKMSKLDAMLLRPMIKVDHIGLINLVAGKRIMNEFVQNDFTAETLTAELFRLIDSDTNKKARNELRLATEKLKTGASKNAAESIIEKLTIARH
ncbi:MAG: hypothetical protein ACRD6X_18105, partial [Pyrinomonadaceae bacterium]